LRLASLTPFIALRSLHVKLRQWMRTKLQWHQHDREREHLIFVIIV
jgi:hypothetical protein